MTSRSLNYKYPFFGYTLRLWKYAFGDSCFLNFPPWVYAFIHLHFLQFSTCTNSQEFYLFIVGVHVYFLLNPPLGDQISGLWAQGQVFEHKAQNSCPVERKVNKNGGENVIWLCDILVFFYREPKEKKKKKKEKKR